MNSTTIIGGAGYTGGELIRILLNHPRCEIKSVHSRSQAGNHVHKVHSDLAGETDLVFSDEFEFDVDIIFLCMGHGESEAFMLNHQIPRQVHIVDLSQDFRYNNNADQRFVYGLPELNRSQLINAVKVANPGCFATAIQLALLPLAKENMLEQEIHVSGITGSTGAGQGLTATSHFTWRYSNISLYKPFIHQHLYEIIKTLESLQKKTLPAIRFLPFRGSFTRGILTTVYTKITAKLEELYNLFIAYYKPHPFVTISEQNPDLKQVVNTNKAILHLQKQEDQLLITCIIDNLIKGASGQAVQNMNLMLGLDESSGLKLKPTGY
jgi:N-acetyl-gamma-glutamyl-phosphate reductase